MLIEGIEFEEQESNGEFVLTAKITDIETFKKINQVMKAHGGSYRKPMSFVFATKPVFGEQPKEEKFEDHVSIIKVSEPVKPVQTVEAEPVIEDTKVEEVPKTEVIPEATEPEVITQEVEEPMPEPEPVEEEKPEAVEDKIVEMPQPKQVIGESKNIEASKKLLEIMQKKQRLLDEMNKRNSESSAPKTEAKTEVKAAPVNSTPTKQPLEDVTQKLKAITAKIEAEKAAAKPAPKAKAETKTEPKAESKGVEVVVYPASTVEECEEFFNKLKESKEWADQQEHKEFMDMIVKSCKEDEELRAFVTHKDYYKTWEAAGRTYCRSVKEHKHGCTKEQLLPYMITEYKKPFEKAKK
jgi:hypothetical protein